MSARGFDPYVYRTTTVC